MHEIMNLNHSKSACTIHWAIPELLWIVTRLKEQMSKITVSQKTKKESSARIQI